MAKKPKEKQKPTEPPKALADIRKRKAPPWMSDDTRVVFAEEAGNEDG